MRELPLPLLKRPPQWPASHAASHQLAPASVSKQPLAEVTHPRNSFVRIQGGDVTIGRGSHQEPESYGWDNEFGEVILNSPSWIAILLDLFLESL